MTDFVAIPTAVFESDAYAAMSAPERNVLLRLYVLYSDCDSFTIDTENPKVYGYEWGTTLLAKLKHLIDAGLLQERDRKVSGRSGPRQRVFGFTHSAAAVYERVAA